METAGGSRKQGQPRHEWGEVGRRPQRGWQFIGRMGVELGGRGEETRDPDPPDDNQTEITMESPACWSERPPPGGPGPVAGGQRHIEEGREQAGGREGARKSAV